MKKSAWKILAYLLALVIAFTIPASAAQADNLLGAYITGQTITVFTVAELGTDDLKCSASNQGAEVLAVGTLEDNEAITKTTILVDISTSVPSSMRENVIATLNRLIESKAANEEYRLVTFGEKLDMLTDFSADRYDLSNAVGKIEFNGTQSKIYDAIYNTIPAITADDGEIVFHRTIVFTDGVDDTANGITREELFIRLQNERYPIDIVEISRQAVAENKDLAAIARMSNGRYHSFNPQSDIAELVCGMDVRGYSYLQAKVPAPLLDGSIRQLDITDGSVSISADIKFPVFDAPPEPTPEPEPEPESKPESKPVSVAVTPPALVIKEEPEPVSKVTGEYTSVVFIGAGIALFVIIALVIVLVLTRSRRNKNTSYSAPLVVSQEQEVDIYADRTEFFNDVSYSNVHYTIKLSNQNNPSQTWTLPVTSDLLIGRAEHCHVRLEDKSVSREQCKITLHGSALAVVYMGSTNKTSLNGSNLVASSPIQSGDTLKLGRVTLRIDYIQALGNPPQSAGTPQSRTSGKTESIF